MRRRGREEQETGEASMQGGSSAVIYSNNNTGRTSSHRIANPAAAPAECGSKTSIIRINNRHVRGAPRRQVPMGSAAGVGSRRRVSPCSRIQTPARLPALKGSYDQLCDPGKVVSCLSASVSLSV